MGNKKEIESYLRDYLISNEAKRIINVSPIINKEGFDVWSFKKLIFLEYYLKPYLQISENHGCTCIYLDLFASSGANEIKGTNLSSIGSPIISLLKGVINNAKKDSNNRFKKWFFLDSNKEFCKALEKRAIEATHIIEESLGEKLEVGKDIEIIYGDCNRSLSGILERIKKEFEGEKLSILCFIDPYAFTNIEWNTWEELLKLRYVDIIFTFPINTIKRGFDQCKNVNKFLPPELIQIKKQKKFSEISDEDFGKCYAKEICKRIFRPVNYFDKGISVKNSSNGELYRIEFFSASPIAVKIALEIGKRLDILKSSDLHTIFKKIFEGQKSLNAWF